MTRTIGMTVLGLIIGILVGIVLFDQGPGVEPVILAMAAAGAALGLLVGTGVRWVRI